MKLTNGKRKIIKVKWSTDAEFTELEENSKTERNGEISRFLIKKLSTFTDRTINVTIG